MNKKIILSIFLIIGVGNSYCKNGYESKENLEKQVLALRYNAYSILGMPDKNNDVTSLILNSGGYRSIPLFATNKKELTENNGLYSKKINGKLEIINKGNIIYKVVADNQKEDYNVKLINANKDVCNYKINGLSCEE